MWFWHLKGRRLLTHPMLTKAGKKNKNVHTELGTDPIIPCPIYLLCGKSEMNSAKGQVCLSIQARGAVHRVKYAKPVCQQLHLGTRWNFFWSLVSTRGGMASTEPFKESNSQSLLPQMAPESQLLFSWSPVVSIMAAIHIEI